MKTPRVFRRVPPSYSHGKPTKNSILLGLCDNEDKTLYINPKQSDRQMLITGIHEAHHYIFPEHSERKVDRDSLLIADVLWKLGYRSKQKE